MTEKLVLCCQFTNINIDMQDVDRCHNYITVVMNTNTVLSHSSWQPAAGGCGLTSVEWVRSVCWLVWCVVVGVKSVDMNINCAHPATPPPTCLARQIPEEAVTSEWYTYHNIHIHTLHWIDILLLVLHHLRMLALINNILSNIWFDSLKVLENHFSRIWNVGDVVKVPFEW